MNNQSYEKARQECWDALRKELLKDEIQWQPVSRKEIVNFVFDRAYALGKQEKDAVTNEEIEKLSFEFAEDKKWHDFNDLRSRARLLRQFITYVEKHTNLKIIQK